MMVFLEFGMGKAPGLIGLVMPYVMLTYAGTSRLGGVLALMGDDHTAESSTTCNQSEFAMVRRHDSGS